MPSRSLKTLAKISPSPEQFSWAPVLILNTYQHIRSNLKNTYQTFWKQAKSLKNIITFNIKLLAWNLYHWYIPTWTTTRCLRVILKIQLSKLILYKTIRPFRHQLKSSIGFITKSKSNQITLLYSLMHTQLYKVVVIIII